MRVKRRRKRDAIDSKSGEQFADSYLGLMVSTFPSTAGRKAVARLKSARGAETGSASDQPKVWWGSGQNSSSAERAAIWNASRAARIDRPTHRRIEMVPFEQISAGNVLSQCDTPRHRRHEGHQQRDGLVSEQTIPPARDEGTHWAGAQRPKAHSSPVERPRDSGGCFPASGAPQIACTQSGARREGSPLAQGRFSARSRREWQMFIERVVPAELMYRNRSPKRSLCVPRGASAKRSLDSHFAFI